MKYEEVSLKDYTDGGGSRSIAGTQQALGHRRLGEVFRPPASSHDPRIDEINESRAQQGGSLLTAVFVGSFRLARE